MTVTTDLETLRAKPNIVTSKSLAADNVFGSIEAFESAQRMAKALMSADVVPANYRQSLGNTLIALEMSQRTGSSVLAVMQNLVVIHGKPAWEAKFLIGAVNTCGKFSPLRYQMTGQPKTDTWGCIAWAYDAKTEEKLDGPEVTIAMAKAENWYQKSGSKWQTMPEVMLRYRAASFWAKQFAPEISLGMQTAEEVHDIYEARSASDGTFTVEAVKTYEQETIREPASQRPQQESHGDEANAGTPPDRFPKKIGPHDNDWVDVDGLPYDPDLWAWDGANNTPSHTADGRFRAGRYKAIAANKQRTDFIARKANPDAPPAAQEEQPPVDFGGLE